MPGHDIIAIGASAGGVERLLELAAALPRDLPESLFVVIHQPAPYVSPLPDLLSARGPLPATHPVHGEVLAPGHIYVAPPDNHLLVRPGFVEVVRGPKENGHRPAVDPLFRTASRSYGPRVVGVVLTGYRDCGTAGMLSIKARGGVAVVQAPDTALAPEMPASVLASVPVDHVVTPAELPALLVRLAAEPAAAARPEPPGRAVEELEGEVAGARADVVCPLCHGVLTEDAVGRFQHFRCHVGHAFSLESLAREQAEETERALWAAVRALEESAALSTRLARTGRPAELRPRFADKARVQRRQADVLRQLILREAAGEGAIPRPDAPG